LGSNRADPIEWLVFRPVHYSDEAIIRIKNSDWGGTNAVEKGKVRGDLTKKAKKGKFCHPAWCHIGDVGVEGENSDEAKITGKKLERGTSRKPTTKQEVKPGCLLWGRHFEKTFALEHQGFTQRKNQEEYRR